MRYGKRQVNEILDKVLDAAKTAIAEQNQYYLEKQVELIREEHLLVDRRKSALSEYTADILFDFLTLKMSYKELMEKYHCSFRNLRNVLDECAENDVAVADEMQLRRK